jgi:predicted DNA-binding transcriptional regulator AlpA
MQAVSPTTQEWKMRQRIFRTREAAEYLGLAASTLEKMRLSSDGPRFVRLGGRAVGYDVRDLDSWLDQQRDETEAAHRDPA